jgi:catechol 2,3-dioxygenase-like lactoylglutathione lyase family enzyme
MDAPQFTSAMPSLPVAQMDDAIAYYTDNLGFSLVFRNGSTFAIVVRDSIELGLTTSAVSGISPGQGRCYLKLTGIETLYAGYVAKGVSILHDLREESYGMKEFMIADPDRNEINFGEPIR